MVFQRRQHSSSFSSEQLQALFHQGRSRRTVHASVYSYFLLCGLFCARQSTTDLRESRPSKSLKSEISILIEKEKPTLARIQYFLIQKRLVRFCNSSEILGVTNFFIADIRMIFQRQLNKSTFYFFFCGVWFYAKNILRICYICDQRITFIVQCVTVFDRFFLCWLVIGIVFQGLYDRYSILN